MSAPAVQAPPAAAGASLRIAGVSAGYGARRVVEGVTLAPIPPGSLVAVVGPNGAGKSTFLKALAGLASAGGQALFGDADLVSCSRRRRAEIVGFMPQGSPRGVRLTVFESMVGAVKAAPIERVAVGLAQAERRAAETLDGLGLSPLAEAPLDTLSGGQRQIVSFAQTIVREPQVLLLDEPTSALDLRHQADLMGRARDFASRGGLVLVVLHDLNLAVRWADRIVVLDRGRLHREGPPAEVLTPAMLAEVYGVEARVETCSHGRPQVIVDR